MSRLVGIVTERWSPRPIEGATVTLNSHLATSDVNGSFAFPDVAPNRYTLRVMHRNYRMFETPIDMTVDHPDVRIELTPIFRVLSR